MPVRLGAAAQQSIRLGAAQVTRMYLGAAQVYSSAPPEPPAPRPDMPAPSSLTAVAANATVTLNWTNGVTATSHVIQQSTDGGSSWSEATASVTGQPTATVTGLTNGTTYRFRVAAQTALGLTAFSAASASVRPIGAPAAPQLLAISGTLLTWRMPAETGGALPAEIRYIIQRGTGSAGSQVWSVHETLTGITEYALTGSCTASYWWRVAANTPGGQSAYSDAIAQTATGASQPPTCVGSAWVDLQQCDNGLRVNWQRITEPTGETCDSPTHFELWVRKQAHGSDTGCGPLSGFTLAATVPVLQGAHPLHIYAHDVRGLDPASAYFVAVRATNAAGACPEFACSPFALRPGDSNVPIAPQDVFSTEWGGRSQLWVGYGGSLGVESLEFQFWQHAIWPPQFSNNPVTNRPYQWGPCTEGDWCQLLTRNNYLSATLFDGCKVGPYFTWTWGGEYSAFRFRANVAGRYSPWAYFRTNGSVNCNATPPDDPPGPPAIFYVRGGKQSVRIQRDAAEGRACAQGQQPQPPTDWWLEYREAGHNEDGSLLHGTGAWAPMTVAATEGFVAAVPSAKTLEVRLRGENDWGIGAAGTPIHVRTWASGGTLAGALNASGTMLFDDASAWTQPVLASPATHMAAGRYLTVARHCIVSLSAAIGSTNSGAGPASVSIAVSDAGGAHIGYIAHKTRANATVRLSFYAKPNRRYSVEVTDTANQTTAITNCYSEDIYDKQYVAPRVWSINDCLQYQRLRTSVPQLLTASSAFAFPAGKDGSAAEWFGPKSMYSSGGLDDNSYWVRAAVRCRIYYKVTGAWNVYYGVEGQRRQHVLYEGTSAQSSSNHSSVLLETGQYLTFARTSSSGQTATLNYLYAELTPLMITNYLGSEFASQDALGGESGMLAADKNGL